MPLSRFAIPAILLLIVCSACRQSKSQTPTPPALGVEFDEPNADPAMTSTRHMDLPEGGAGTEIQLDAHNTLALQFMVDADKVITTAYIIPPESDRLRYSDGHKRLVGTYSARLNDSVTLNELRNIGYVPFTIRIVKARPPQTAHPQLISKVPSIQIAITEQGAPYFGDADTPSCSVILHNLSSSAVLAYFLSEGHHPKTGDTSGQGTLPSYAGPAIEPGKDSGPLEFTFRHATQMTPQGMVKLPAPPQQIVLEAALFSDGSFEGERKVAADLKARDIENRRFYRAMMPIIDRIAGDLSLNDDTRVARIKEEIFRVPGETDEATLHSLETKFPDLHSADLATDLTRGLEGAKNDVWGRLDAYVSKCCQSPPPDHTSVPEWWQRERRRIETFLNSSR